MKKAQFDFVWIFAIVAGAVILFLAIYGAMSFGNIGTSTNAAQVVKKLSILTNPMQAGFADSSYGKISFSQNVGLKVGCFFDGAFGSNDISARIESGMRTQKYGDEIPVQNKYLFSKKEIVGTDFHIYSLPFVLGYKINDILIMTTDTYCFKQAPPAIKESLSSAANIHFNASCAEEEVSVCFPGARSGDCDVRVTCSGDCIQGSIQKEGRQITFLGNLLYAAIVSDKDIYDCTLQRLFYRGSKQAELLNEKISLMKARGCDSNLQLRLIQWRAALSGTSPENILSLASAAGELERINDMELCKVW